MLFGFKYILLVSLTFGGNPPGLVALATAVAVTACIC
jgi:hypothetical protein